jgi:hypothetical protein
MEPINYLAQVADPFAASLKGYASVDAILNADAKRAELARQQQLQQQQQQLAMQEQARFFTNPNPTMRDAARYASLLTPEQSKAFLPFMEGISKEKQQGILKSTGQTLSALQLNPEIGINKLKQDALAARNSGDMEDAALFERLAEAAADPKQGKAVVFQSLVARTAGIPGAKEMFETFSKGMETAREEALAPSKLTQAQEEAKKAKSEAEIKATEAKFTERLQQAGLTEKNWNVKNLQSQINNRAAQLKLDAQRTQAEVADKLSSIQSRLTSLPESAQKLVNESAVNASTAKQASDQYTEIAKQLDGLGNSWGALNNLGEWSKSQFGNQDFRTAIQNEYTRLANSAGIKAYKAAGATGGFSDADLNTALQGIPKANANPKIMAQFMRGMAKEQAISAALDNAKTDWLSQNKGQLGRASGTFLAGDYAVKPGETYADFTARVTKDVVKKFTTPAQSTLVNQIPTDRNPAPAAAQNNIRSQADAILSGGR